MCILFFIRCYYYIWTISFVIVPSSARFKRDATEDSLPTPSKETVPVVQVWPGQPDWMRVTDSPVPPTYDDGSVYWKVMKELNKPYNPNIGIGISYVQPFMIGGDVKFPTGNIDRPQESVSGSFGFARPVNVRYGMQGGPFYPWQDPNYARNLEAINDRNFLKDSFKRDNLNKHLNQLNLVPNHRSRRS